MEFDGERIRKAVLGALKDSINTHGPITKDTITSAEKRIHAAVKVEWKKMKQDDTNVQEIWNAWEDGVTDSIELVGKMAEGAEGVEAEIMERCLKSLRDLASRKPVIEHLPPITNEDDKRLLVEQELTKAVIATTRRGMTAPEALALISSSAAFSFGMTLAMNGTSETMVSAFLEVMLTECRTQFTRGLVEDCPSAVIIV